MIDKDNPVEINISRSGNMGFWVSPDKKTATLCFYSQKAFESFLEQGEIALYKATMEEQG